MAEPTRARELPLAGRVGAAIAGRLVTALMASTRSELIRGEAVERDYLKRLSPCVFVLWHGRILPVSFRYKGFGVGTLISQNRDGDYITGMMRSWGYEVLRGSSSRGGSRALRDIVRLLKRGIPVALTPDGPRGPRQKMKLGPLQAAAMAGVPVIPAAAGARHAAYFGSWDRFLVPAPFTYSPYAFGDPVEVPRAASEAELRHIAERVEGALNDLTGQVDEAARGRR